MKELFVSLFILMLNYSLFGQETKFITRTSSDIKKSKETKGKGSNTLTIGPDTEFIEEYYVLKSDESIRHGTYVKYRQTFRGIQILESGSFQNGQKNGLWEYYHDIPTKNTSNSIKEKGQYANGRKNGVWTSYYMDTIPEIINQEKFGNKRKTDSINISIEQRSVKIKLAGMYLNDKRVGEWSSFTYSGDTFQKYNFSKNILISDLSIKNTLEYNINRNALFIGGLPCLIDFLTNEFNLTGGLMPEIKSDSTSTIVSFTIDKDGKVIEPKIESTTGNKGLENEALRIVALTNNKWIPAISGGAMVNSIYRIHFFIIEKRITQTYKQFKIGYKPIFD
jgi:antitoxin component YwqK of YwqJK toxin-antitoxin module